MYIVAYQYSVINSIKYIVSYVLQVPTVLNILKNACHWRVFNMWCVCENITNVI